jgi:hypothetical protein
VRARPGTVAVYSALVAGEMRTRLVSVVSGDVLVNIIPGKVNLEKIIYKQERKAVRVSDGSDWHLDLSEYTWM